MDTGERKVLPGRIYNLMRVGVVLGVAAELKGHPGTFQKCLGRLVVVFFKELCDFSRILPVLVGNCSVWALLEAEQEEPGWL